MEDLFNQFTKIGAILESILSDSLGLPPSTLHEFNNDRNSDVSTALYYLPATEEGKIGVNSHKDVGCITFVLQDEVGGLEVQKDGKWIPVIPIKGALVVNIGIVLQVKKENIITLFFLLTTSPRCDGMDAIPLTL